MTDFFELAENARRIHEKAKEDRRCRAESCLKDKDGRFFCIRHWYMLGRSIRSNLHHGTKEMQEAALEHAQELIRKNENGGRE